MKCNTFSPIFTFYLLFVSSIYGHDFPESKRIELKNEARDMFYHSYNAYMDNAFPADELMPLSCRGRYRGVEPDRGDIDDALGNFSLTLIDSLDTLVVLGDVKEFERGVRLVIDNVSFDHDVPVSVFETNIRVVGGLLSSHIMAELLQIDWYKGELLTMALDVATRLLPAFNSTTGLPHPRVNLKYGIRQGKVKQVSETCSSCAGTMLLEFAALSRLSGEPIFEEKAKAAMDVLWASRHRQSNLVGNVLNINTGDWIRRDSGVGAGIDSYYEYVAKAYILLGDDTYLSRWTAHYSSIMKFIGHRPVLQDVHMHRPSQTSKHFIDALGAFWPGLQVLMGDLKPAIESHEVLYQILQRHDFIPEAFTSDFQVHWGEHLLRPEFIESTYFLYKATLDPYYLQVGETVLRSLQKHARVTCGYASIKDVRTMQKEDRMDSFVLAETFKYLYLLFADASDLIIDVDSFVFTTEGHLLPLSLARLSPSTAVPLKNARQELLDEDVELARSCPSMNYLFPGNLHYAQDIRLPLANFVPTRTKTHTIVRKLHATDFQSNNDDHLELVKNMGINIISLPDGRVQLVHSMANAKTLEDGEEGLLFMQEMIDLSKQQTNLPATEAKAITFTVDKEEPKVIFAGPAQFGRDLTKEFSVKGRFVLADPIKACSVPDNAKEFWGKIVVMERGDCMFVEKARIIEKAGAKGGVVIDNNKGTSSTNSPLFSMSGDGVDDVSIPVVFVFRNDAKPLLEALLTQLKVEGKLSDSSGSVKNEESTQGKNSFDQENDIASPVRSFLEKSKMQVEKYFREQLSIMKDENHNEDDEEDDESADHLQEATEVSSRISRLADFLNPDNGAIKNLIEHRVLKNPRLLSELLEVNFSDLLTVFQNLIQTKATSVEAAYLHVLQLVEDEGATGISKMAGNFIQDPENDDLVHAYASGVSYEQKPVKREETSSSQDVREEL